MTRPLLLLFIFCLMTAAACGQRKAGDGGSPPVQAQEPAIVPVEDRKVNILVPDAGAGDQALPVAPPDNTKTEDNPHHPSPDAGAGGSSTPLLERPPPDTEHEGPKSDKQPPRTKDRKPKYNEDFGVE